MRRIMSDGVRAFAGAAALVLSMAAVAPAQQAQPDPAPLTEAQTAGVRRLKELIEVLNTADYAKIRAYFEANSVDIRTDVPGVKAGSWNVTAFASALDRYSASRGIDVVRVTTEPSRGDVVGIFRNRTTGMRSTSRSGSSRRRRTESPGFRPYRRRWSPPGI